MNKKNLLRYIRFAAIIDCEGCIYAEFNPARNGTFVRVDVSMKDGRIIDWLSGAIGGYASLTRNRYGDVFCWHLQGAKNVEPVLKRALPFFVLKKRQAEVALRLCSRILHQPHGPSGKMTDHERDLRSSLVQELKMLKRDYKPSRVALETKRGSALSDAIVQGNGNKTVAQDRGDLLVNNPRFLGAQTGYNEA